MNFLEKLFAMLRILPHIIGAVKAAETLIPIPGKGKEKLDIILGVVNDIGGEAVVLIPEIVKTVSRIVEAANRVGAFTKPPTP